MKLHPASRKEIRRIALGTLAGDGILIALLLLGDLLGLRKFDPASILPSVAIGSAVGIGSFTLLCLTVQSALGTEDQKRLRARLRLSSNFRMLLQAGWVVTAFAAEPFHFLAGALPVFFPKLTILVLQATGRLLPTEDEK